MAILLPRLKLTNRALDKLKQAADRSGLTTAALIADILERSLNDTAPGNETLYRILMVAERYGLGIAGTAYPVDWRTIGGLTDAKCREVTAGYEEWKKTNRG